MNFVIPAGSATNLPKELVDKIVDLAVEKSVLFKLIANRQQSIEIVNEGTIPVLGEEGLDKVYRLDSTTDITSLTEQAFDIRTPDLFPVEVGSYLYLKKKHVEQYPELKLDELFEKRLARGIGRSVDKLGIVGDTDAVGATNLLGISNGIYTIANSAALCATTAVSYTTSNAQTALDAVAEALQAIGVYGDDEFADDLYLFASADFLTTCRTAANRDVIGYDIADLPELGLKNVIHLWNVPVVKRTFITGEKAVLVNMRGCFVGYYGKIAIDAEHKAGRRADLLVTTYWIDFKFAFINASSKALGVVLIYKTS